MLGAVELLCIDLAVLGGLWLGVGRVVTRITRMFALPTLPLVQVVGLSKDNDDKTTICRWIMIGWFLL